MMLRMRNTLFRKCMADDVFVFKQRRIGDRMVQLVGIIC